MPSGLGSDSTLAKDEYAVASKQHEVLGCKSSSLISKASLERSLEIADPFALRQSVVRTASTQQLPSSMRGTDLFETSFNERQVID